MLSCVVFTACQPITVQHHDEGPLPVSVRVDDTAYWLEEWRRVSLMSEIQFKLAVKNREQEFERKPDPRTRLRLALLLATGPAPKRDQSRALVLLKGMDDDGASESAQALAALVMQMIEEQLWSGDKMTELKGKLSKADARIDELEQQLQALTNIEQSIQQRETPGDRKEKQ
jgi:hypothetical protein